MDWGPTRVRELYTCKGKISLCASTTSALSGAKVADKTKSVWPCNSLSHSPVSLLHTFTTNWGPEAVVCKYDLPSCAQVTEYKFSAPTSVRSQAPVLRFHIFVVPSKATVTICLPSAVKLAEFMLPLCPSKICLQVPNFMSHTFAMPSLAPVTAH